MKLGHWAIPMPELTLIPLQSLTPENFRLRCELDKQGGRGLKLKKLKLKGDVLYRPGPAELGHNSWNLPFRHIYYVLQKSPYGGQFWMSALDLFSIVLYMVPTVKHMHGMGHLTAAAWPFMARFTTVTEKRTFFANRLVGERASRKKYFCRSFLLV